TQRLNEAQRELLDPNLRASYDRTLRVFSTRPTHSYAGAGARGYSQPQYSAGNFRSSTSSSSSSTPRRESAAPWPPAAKARLVTAAGLWPLAAAGVEPFAQLATGGLWASVLPCLTLIVIAVIGFRTVAPLASEMSRIRPRQRTAAGFAR